MAWTKPWDGLLLTKPNSGIGGSWFLTALQEDKRADERTRTAALLITSDRSCVAGACTGLLMPHI
jgi:hypothetical protein